MPLAPRLRLEDGGSGTAGEPRAPRRALELMGIGAGLTAVCTFAGQLPSWRVELVALQLAMFVGFALLAVALARLPAWRQLPHAGLAVVVVALAMRLAVIGVTPTLSDDLYRYVWDGKVAAHGIDPYAYAPADTALAALRDRTIQPRINHPDLRTIYPPVAEAGFALVASIAPTVRAMKLWIVLNDLALVSVLVVWLGRRGLSPLGAIAYAWNPLVVIEYAGSGHHDPTALLWLVVALAFADERPVLSALALSAAALVKLFPLLALPFLFRHWPWRARLVALFCLVAGLGSFAQRALGPASGLAAFSQVWRNNDSLFTLLEGLVTPGGARVAAMALLGAFAIVLLFRSTETATATRRMMRASVLLGPVAHPWYFGWPLALEPLQPSAPWLLLSCLAILSYGPLAVPSQGGGYHLTLAWRMVEYGLPASLAAWLAWRERGARKGLTLVD